MKQPTDERLRDAIHAYARTIEPAPAGWDRLQARVKPRRNSVRRWQVAVAGAGAVAVITLVVVAVRTLGAGVGPGDRPTVPQEVVALSIPDTRIVVLSAKDGRILRLLDLPASSRATLGVSVSPDGRYVYFDRPTQGAGPCYVPEVYRVPVKGGERIAVTQGGLAAPSPNGRFLAVVRTASGESCADDAFIVVHDLRSGGERVYPVSVGGRIGRISWAPNSRDLLFSGSGSYILDTRSDPTAPRTNQVHAPGNLLLQGYLGRSGLLMAMDVKPGGPVQVVGLDSTTLAIRRRLVTVNFGFQTVDSDPTGRHLVFVENVDTQGGINAVRWSVGDKASTQIGDGLLRVAWVPRKD
jgi:hypothetical protein